MNELNELIHIQSPIPNDRYPDFAPYLHRLCKSFLARQPQPLELMERDDREVIIEMLEQHFLFCQQDWREGGDALPATLPSNFSEEYYQESAALLAYLEKHLFGIHNDVCNTLHKYRPEKRLEALQHTLMQAGSALQDVFPMIFSHYGTLEISESCYEEAFELFLEELQHLWDVLSPLLEESNRWAVAGSSYLSFFADDVILEDHFHRLLGALKQYSRAFLLGQAYGFSHMDTAHKLSKVQPFLCQPEKDLRFYLAQALIRECRADMGQMRIWMYKMYGIPGYETYQKLSHLPQNPLAELIPIVSIT